MELELGLKVTRTREDVSSSVDFRFSKDPFGPLVLSRETDSMFIIIIHLKGFKKEGVEIDINKEGDRITIRGRKPVEEMVMIRWMAWRKEVEMRAFRKVFLIPDVVDLDKIKARFDDDDATLTITMPKRVKGISGFNLEQEEEEEEEGVDFGDVSEVENREEVEDENEERDESDEHSEIQGEEGFGEMVEDDEKESQVYEGEEEGFSGGVDETQIEDDDLEEIQKIGQQELADSDTESEDNVLKKVPDIMEQEDNQEVMEKRVSEEIKNEEVGSGETEEIEEQESDEDSGFKKLPDIIEHEDDREVMEQKVSEETKSDDIGSEATEEIEKQESDENSGLEKLPDKIEQEDNQEVMEQKFSEEAKSDEIGSEAVEEIEEQESDGNSGSDTTTKGSGFEKLPDIIEQEDNQKVRELRVSEETKSDDSESGEVEEIQEQESHEDSGLKELPDIIGKKYNQEVLEQKVSDEIKSDDTGCGPTEEIEGQESHEEVGLKQLPDTGEQEDNQEVMDKIVSEETKSADTESGAVEEIEEQKSDVISGTSKSKATEKEKTYGDDGLGKAQGIEEPEKHNEESKIQEMIEEETGGQEKDPKREYDGKATQIKDDKLEKSQQTDEEETVGRLEFADSNPESEDSVLRKLPDILEQEDNQDVMEQKDSQEETGRNDFGSGALEEIERQEPHGQLDETTKSRAKADDDGLSKVQGTEEPERRNKVRTIQEMVEGDPKEDVDAEMGEGFTPNIDRTRVVAETETPPEEPESEKKEADKVDKKHELVEKKEEEEENSKVRRKSEHRRSLIELQENEEQRSKGRKRQDKQENIKELVEEKALEAEKNIKNDVPKPVQKTEAPVNDTVVKTDDEGKEEKSVKMETAPNIAETETEPEDIESEKLGAGEVDKIHKPVEKKEDDDTNVRAKGEYSILTNLQENKEHHSKGRKGEDKQENIKESVEDKAPKAEKNIVNDIPKPVQEIEVPEVGTLGETCDEGKEKKSVANIVETDTKPEDFESDKLEADEVDKIHELVEKKKEEEDAKSDEAGPQSEDITSIKPHEAGEQQSQGQKQQEKYEKIKELVEEKTPEADTNRWKDTPKPVKERCEGTNDTDSRKTQETIRQQELDECEKESKTQELVKRKTNDEEKDDKEPEETVTKEQESCRPKVLREEEKVKELDQEMTHFPKNGKAKEEEELTEKETELGDDEISRKSGDSDDKEEVDAEMGKGFTPNIAETETKPEDFDSEKVGEDEVEKIHKLVEKKEDEDANVRRKGEDRSLIKIQEDKEPHSKGKKRQEKQESIKELVEEKSPEAEKNVASDVLKPVQEIGPEVVTLVARGDESKEKKKSALEVKNKDDREELDANLSVTNAAETETKPEEFESEKLGADEVDKIYELVEKKKEEEEGTNAKVGVKSEDISSIKAQEVGEKLSQGQKRHKKIKELVGEKNPEAETTIENDTPKPFQDTEAPEVGTVFKTDDERKEEKEKKKSVKVIGEGFAPNTTETETKPEDFVSEKQGAAEVDKLHKPVEKKEEEVANVRAKGEDRSFIKLQENEEKYSKGRKRQEKQENIKQLMEEKAPEAETNIVKGVSKPVQETEVPELGTVGETGDEGKEKKIVANVAETETKPEEFVPYKLKADEVDKIYELVGKKKEEDDENNAKVGTESEDTSLLKPHDIEEQQSQGPTQHGEQEKAEEETGIANDTLKPVQERGEGKQKIPKLFQEPKNQPEEYKEKMVETEKRIDDVVSREVQEIIRQQELDEAERCEQESKTLEEVKSKTNDEGKEEKGTEETETKEQDSYKPKILWEEEIAEKKTNFGDEEEKDSDSKEEFDVEMGKGFTLNVAETETKGEEFESQKLEPDENDDIHELFEKKEEENAKLRRQDEDRSLLKLQENEKQHSKGQKQQEKTAETEVDKLGKTGDEGKEGNEKKKSVSLIAKEEVDAKNGKGFAPNTAETETKPEDLESDEVDELVWKKEEEEDNAKMRRQSEDSNLSKKLQETKEQQDKIKELVEEKTPAAETTQIPKPTQEIEEPEMGMLETCEEEKIAETDTETMEQELYRPKVFGDDHHHISRKVGDTRQRDSDPKEEDDPEMGKGSAPNITETEKKSDTIKAVEEDRIHEVVEKKNDKVRRQSEDTGLKRLQEEKFHAPNLHSKQEKIKQLVEEKPVEETERSEVSTLETCEDKVSAETETKDQESYRPKILEGEDTIQELAAEKMNISREVEEEEETAKKKTELPGDDDMSRKAGDIDAQEKEKEKIQESVLEEKVSDGSKKIVSEAITAENDKPRKAQEIDEQKSHEEDELIEGETSGHGEVKGVESEKKTTEVDKRFRETQEIERTDSGVSGEYGKGELQEEEKEDEDDILERRTGKIEQELVDLNSQMEKEPGEKTQELVDEEINNGKEEESETKTDDVITTVQGTKEQELFEPEKNHGTNIKEVIEKKTSEAEKEDECGGLSEVHGSEEQELHEPSVQERGKEDKDKVLGSMRITEKESSPTAQEIKDQRPDKESNEKQHKTKELVEAGHNVHKEEKKDEKLTVKAKHETEEGTSKGVQEIETHESDGLKRFALQDKKQETEENEITRAMEEKDVVDRRTVTEDVSLRKYQEDGEPEMSKPYKRQEEDKIQEQVELGASDYKEKVNNQDGIDISRSQEPGKPNLDELERHGEQTNIPQGEDKIPEPVKMRTHDYREKVKKQDGDDVPQSVEEEKVENMSELEGRVEDDSSDKFHEFEERKPYEDWTHETWEKSKEEATDPKESEEKDKARAVEEKEILDRRTITRDDAETELSKPYKTQEEDKVHESVETGTSDCREEVKKQDVDDTLRSKEESTGPGDKRTSEKVAEIEKQKSDELKRFLVQDKMQETEENEETRAIKENEIQDGSLRKVQDGKEAESSKPYKRLDEDRIKELVERKTSDYREKVKTQDGDDIQERDEEISQTKTKVEDETKKEVEKNQKEEEEEPMTKTQESEKEESEIHEKLDIVQGFVDEETRDQEDEVAMEAPALEANYDDDSSRTLQTIEEPGERKEQKNDPGVEETKEKEAYDDWTQEERGMMKDLVKEEALDLKHTSGEGNNDHKEEQHEEKFIPKAEVKAEEDSSEQEFDELQRSLVQDKRQETEEEGKTRSMEENDTVEGRTRTEDGSLRKVQEGEDPELSRHKRHEEEVKKEDVDGILKRRETSKPDLGEETEKEESVEDKTWDQEDERVEEAAAVVENNEKDISRKLHTTTGGEELKEHEEQDEIPATSDPRVKEGDGERVAKKEKTMERVHVQEPEGKTENEESRRGQIGKQEKNVETRSDDGIVRKVGETKVQEPDEKKDQEPGGKIEEPERKEASNDGVKLVAEEDNLIKGQEIIEKESSKRRPVGQENIQQLMDAEKQEDEGKSDAGVEMQAKIKEEKGTEGSEKVAEVEMQAKIGIRMKDQETKRQELYELNEEHDKVPEPVVKGTDHQREREKRVEDREVEEMNRKSEDFSSREVQKIKSEDSDGLEKDKELSGFQESQTVKEEEVNEAGGYKPVLTTKSMDDSIQSQDVEEKRSDQTERYAEQEEQNEKAKRMPQVESKANDDSSKINETERSRGKKQKEDHQDLVEMETSDWTKEKKEEKIVGKEVTRYECEGSSKSHEHEEELSDKLEEMCGSLAKEAIRNDEEENRGNRAGAETTIKDDGLREEQLEMVLKLREKDKKQLVVEKDRSGKAKDKRNQETKSRDDSSRKTLENEKQDSHEQKRNYEEQDKKNMGPNYFRNEEDGKEDKETAEAEGTRKKEGIGQREATKVVEEKMNNQEEDKKRMSTEVLKKSEDHESKEPERVRKQDNGSELVQQRSIDNPKGEETTKTETEVKDTESRKTHQLTKKETSEEEILNEKENRETECEDGSSKKIQEIDKEGSSEPRKDEERDKIQPVDSETSEDEEEEELEVEVEDSEEDWEAEVIQEMDSDEDNDKLRKIRRIKLGFRLVGGSTLFMSLIVIVISIIRSKRKARCYKF